MPSSRHIVSEPRVTSFVLVALVNAPLLNFHTALRLAATNHMTNGRGKAIATRVIGRRRRVLDSFKLKCKHSFYFGKTWLIVDFTFTKKAVTHSDTRLDRVVFNFNVDCKRNLSANSVKLLCHYSAVGGRVDLNFTTWKLTDLLAFLPCFCLAVPYCKVLEVYFSLFYLIAFTAAVIVGIHSAWFDRRRRWGLNQENVDIQSPSTRISFTKDAADSSETTLRVQRRRGRSHWGRKQQYRGRIRLHGDWFTHAKATGLGRQAPRQQPSESLGRGRRSGVVGRGRLWFSILPPVPRQGSFCQLFTITKKIF